MAGRQRYGAKKIWREAISTGGSGLRRYDINGFGLWLWTMAMSLIGDKDKDGADEEAANIFIIATACGMVVSWKWKYLEKRMLLLLLLLPHFGIAQIAVALEDDEDAMVAMQGRLELEVIGDGVGDYDENISHPIPLEHSSSHIGKNITRWDAAGSYQLSMMADGKDDYDVITSKLPCQ